MGRVMVGSCAMHYIYESPPKDRNRRICVNIMDDFI